MGNVYADMGKDPRDLSFKKAYCLGEPLPNKKRELIEDLFDIEVFCGYGLSEVGAGAECCEKRGFHWPTEDILVEVLDEQYGKGELTYTALKKTGTLAIRFRSRDLGYIIEEPCSCGEKSPLISYIEERIDDLVKIKGTLISPYAIEEAMYSIKGVKNYLFVVDDGSGLDTVSIYIEGRDVSEEIVRNVINGATFITPKHVRLVPKDSIPIIGRKIRRFYDLRKNNPLNNTVRNYMKDFESTC
jgi:phenylacetate-CoA ligase